MKQILVQGHTREAPGQSSSGAGHQRYPEPENRDSQHMLNQSRGSDSHGTQQGQHLQYCAISQSKIASSMLPSKTFNVLSGPKL